MRITERAAKYGSTGDSCGMLWIVLICKKLCWEEISAKYIQKIRKKESKWEKYW